MHDQPLDIAPGYDHCTGTLIGVIAAVHEVASNGQLLAGVFQARGEALEVREKIRRRRGAGFDLDGVPPVSLLDQQIYFKPTPLPIMDNLSIQLTNEY